MVRVVYYNLLVSFVDSTHSYLYFFIIYLLRNDNGNWLVTGSRDQIIKLYDIRAMRELCSLKGHNKEITSLAWHPLHESVFASGGMDGTLIYWNIGPKGSEEPAVRLHKCSQVFGFIIFAFFLSSCFLIRKGKSPFCT